MKNNNSLTNNIRNFRHGTEPLVRPIEDLNILPGIPGNSWFWVGHFESEGHILNFVYHVSVLQFSQYVPVKMINSVLSITDETGKIYRHEDRFYRAKKGQVASKGLSIRCDKDYVVGDLDTMTIKAEMEHGSIAFTIHGKGYPLLNLGTGYFQLAGVINSQYSLPTLESEGTITLDGKRYPVKGNIWLDRQFARPQKGMSLKDGYNCKWIWMNLQFDQSEDVISLWGVMELATEKEYCWATVLHPNGTQASAGVNPMMEDASEVWISPLTKMKYPTRWKVQIPEWDAALDVKSVMDEQEIVAGDPAGRKYEGASRFAGMYKGKEVTGYCCLELVGGWDK